jgi:hypothetical protein
LKNSYNKFTIEETKVVYEKIEELRDLIKNCDVNKIDTPEIFIPNKENMYDKEFLIDSILYGNAYFSLSAHTNDFDIEPNLRVQAFAYFSYNNGELSEAEIKVYNRTIGQRAQGKGNVFSIFSNKTKNILSMNENEFDYYCEKFVKSKKQFKNKCFSNELFIKTIKEMFFELRKHFLAGKEYVDAKKDKYNNFKAGN